jgi:hypothetical protein
MRGRRVWKVNGEGKRGGSGWALGKRREGLGGLGALSRVEITCGGRGGISKAESGGEVGVGGSELRATGLGTIVENEKGRRGKEGSQGREEVNLLLSKTLMEER